LRNSRLETRKCDDAHKDPDSKPKTIPKLMKNLAQMVPCQ
jgi:hypothetical protein